ncbi:transposase [Propionibacterium freudenreichii]|uniref:transposase n=1 Tax=Propionibacterium freudenreichii TaxID=1744 RepID=UPI003D75B521
MVEGRSKKAFKEWLSQQDPAWRDRIEVVAMDGFTGFKTAAKEELPDAVEVMDPFHVVQLAGDALDHCRQRVQQDTTDIEAGPGTPCTGCARPLHTGMDLLTDKQRTRLEGVFAQDAHVGVEATWGIYQKIVAAYRDPDPKAGRAQLAHVIEVISRGVPAALAEIITLGRTLKRRATDVLAYFERPPHLQRPDRSPQWPTGTPARLSLGLPKPDDYIARSLLEAGGFRPQLHPHREEPVSTGEALGADDPAWDVRSDSQIQRSHSPAAYRRRVIRPAARVT